MTKVIFEDLTLAGAVLIDLELLEDERGFFARSYHDDEFAANGLNTLWPQHNISYNVDAGTLRGMHINAAPHGEIKLVRCTSGSIYDVIVDLRPASDTHLSWIGVEISAANRRSLYVPAGFGHGFITLADETTVEYLMGSVYVEAAARGFRWDDPAVGIRWPVDPVVIAERDATYPDLGRALLEEVAL